MSPRSRQHPSIVRERSAAAASINDWLERLLAPLTYEALNRIHDVHLFRLAGTLGLGLLAESSAQLEGRPGVYRTRVGAWVSQPVQGVSFLMTAELHSWDASTEAAMTGNDHWTKVPRAQMYAERDRRTAAIAAELDAVRVEVVRAGAIPDVHPDLEPTTVRTLVRDHLPALLESAAPPDPMKAGPWREFRKRLARALDQMAADTFLILSTRPGPGAGGHYVQFARTPDSLRAEAVGNAYLSGPDELDLGQLALLQHLGWQRPDDEEGAGNWFKMWMIPAPYGDISRLAASTLRSVYGTTDPTTIRYRYESLTQEPVGDLVLGLDRENRPARPMSVPVNVLARVRAQVEESLKEWLELEALVVDSDGDWPIRAGSAMYYVRVVDGVPPAVSVFSPILRDVVVTPDLAMTLNDINAHIRYARVFAIHGTVIAALELPGLDIGRDDIAFACQELGALADHLDDVLHGRFGGTVAFQSRPKLIN